MKLNAVAITSSDIKRSIQFYEILGFQFPKFKDDEQHTESIVQDNETKLMIDSEKLSTELLGEKPFPSNHSSFAIEFDSAEEVNEIAKEVEKNGFVVNKYPWNAFWGQRYCVVEDPDGYKLDLYSKL